MRKITAIFMLLLFIGSVSAISFTPKSDINLEGRYNIINPNTSALPAECLLTNSWISKFAYNSTVCRTMNYTAIIGHTFPELAGSGKALLCVDSNGLIYRGNSTGCP